MMKEQDILPDIASNMIEGVELRDKGNNKVRGLTRSLELRIYLHYNLRYARSLGRHTYVRVAKNSSLDVAEQTV